MSILHDPLAYLCRVIYADPDEEAAYRLGGHFAVQAVRDQRTHDAMCKMDFASLETRMTTRQSRLTDPHLARLREAAAPGVREIEVTADELRMMLNEIDDARIPIIDLEPDIEARTRTTPLMVEAVARWKAVSSAPDFCPAEYDPEWVAFGFFLGLGLDVATARHLSLRV